MKLNRDELSKLPPEKIIELVLSLQEQNEAKDRFFRSMGYELRAPINAILGYNQLVRLQLKGQLTSNVIQCLDCIDERGKYLWSFINDLFDYSKNSHIFADTNTLSKLPNPMSADTKTLSNLAIPPELIKQFHEAAEIGSYTTLESLVVQVKVLDEATAHQLSQWVEDFEYDKILAWGS